MALWNPDGNRSSNRPLTSDSDGEPHRQSTSGQRQFGYRSRKTERRMAGSDYSRRGRNQQYKQHRRNAQ